MAECIHNMNQMLYKLCYEQFEIISKFTGTVGHHSQICICIYEYSFLDMKIHHTVSAVSEQR